MKRRSDDLIALDTQTQHPHIIHIHVRRSREFAKSRLGKEKPKVKHGGLLLWGKRGSDDDEVGRERWEAARMAIRRR